MLDQSQSSPHLRVECPVWHRPLFRIVPGGLEIHCRSCNTIHAISQSKLEKVWSEFASHSNISLIALVCDLQNC